METNSRGVNESKFYKTINRHIGLPVTKDSIKSKKPSTPTTNKFDAVIAKFTPNK